MFSGAFIWQFMLAAVLSVQTRVVHIASFRNGVWWGAGPHNWHRRLQCLVAGQAARVCG